MHRAKLPFSVFKRPTSKKNRYIYYVKFRDDSGEYSTGVSSTKTSKADAINWAYEEIRSGKHRQRSSGAPPFADVATSFWYYDSSRYIASRLARGKSFSKTLAEIRTGIVRNYLVPAFGEKRINAISRREIESTVLAWYQAGTISPATVNRILVTLKVMFKTWNLDGLLESDPAATVQVLKENPKERQILTMAEAQRFFSFEWDDERYRVLNLLAASTGLRLGECLGLQREDLVVEGVEGERYYHIQLQHNWQEREGLKAPKWNSYGNVPVPAVVGSALQDLIKNNPFGNGFVFFGETERAPLSKKYADRAFKTTIHAIGIDEDSRLERGLSFHSWRHWFNTQMRRKVSDNQLRKITRHRSLEMTERYDHLIDADLEVVRAAQDQLFCTKAPQQNQKTFVPIIVQSA